MIRRPCSGIVIALRHHLPNRFVPVGSKRTTSCTTGSGQGRRPFSTAVMEESSTSTTALASEEAMAASLVTRHGVGDGVVTLNVGGKEFITLRSTIQLNPVLHERVATAECNQEFIKGAVFIDRDPKQFHLILQHLRNRADRMQSTSSSKSITTPSGLLAAKKKFMGKKDVLIPIPKDKDAMRDLYVEAKYFQIYELEALICAMDWYTRVANWFGGGAGNPFYAASQAITAARRALLASSGFGIVLGSQNEDLVKNVQGLFSDTLRVLRGESIKKDDDSNTKNKMKEGEQKLVEPTFS